MLPLRGSMPPTDKNTNRPSSPALLAHSDPPALLDRTEAGGIDTVVDDRRVDVEIRLQPVAPVLAHDDQLVGLLDGLPLTLDQRRSGEVVDVVDGADDAYAGAGVSHPSGRACGDAVLGVEDVHLARDLGQPGLEVVYRCEHSLLQGVCGRRRRHQDGGRSHRPEEALVRIAERHDANVHGLINHRLGKRQGVHHTATWLGRIRDQGNAALNWRDRLIHSRILIRPGLSVAIAAATREDLAAVSVTMQPASTSLAR